MPGRDRHQGGHRRELSFAPPGLDAPRRLPSLGRRSGLAVRDTETGQTWDLAAVGEPGWFTTGRVALAAGTSIPTIVRFQSTAGFLITSLRFFESTASPALTVSIVNPSSTAGGWQDRACLGSLIGGNGRFPYVLPVPTFMQPGADGRGAVLTVTIANGTLGAETGELVFEGIKLPLSGLHPRALHALSSESTFFYSNALNIGAGVGTRNQAQFRLHDDSTFELHDLQAGDLTDWQAELQASTSGANFGDQPVTASTLFGDAQRPGQLARPLTLPAGEVLRVFGTNLIAGAQTVEIVLAGVKIWRR